MATILNCVDTHSESKVQEIATVRQQFCDGLCTVTELVYHVAALGYHVVSFDEYISDKYDKLPTPVTLVKGVRDVYTIKFM